MNNQTISDILHLQAVAAMNGGGFVTVIYYVFNSAHKTAIQGYTYKNGGFQGEHLTNWSK